jgi:polyhydroxyalkanoate synthase
MITWYLEDVYHKNLLIKPGGVSLDGTPIDLSKVTTPLYFLSTEEDHICPWESTYHGAGTFKGPITFVLGGSGHNAGVVNPPTKSKYGYRTNDKRPNDPIAWLADARHHGGSWWQHWSDWLVMHSGAEQVAARRPAEGGLAIIEPAPGRYVTVC